MTELALTKRVDIGGTKSQPTRARRARLTATVRPVSRVSSVFSVQAAVAVHRPRAFA